jgi:hypothetical protein
MMRELGNLSRSSLLLSARFVGVISPRRSLDADRQRERVRQLGRSKRLGCQGMLQLGPTHPPPGQVHRKALT